jgi:heterodisulfide reductase subunit A-like polyferredoxin
MNVFAPYYRDHLFRKTILHFDSASDGMITSNMVCTLHTVSGLVCAEELSKQGFKVTVFEAGRGVGGRMATRRVDLEVCHFTEVQAETGLPGVSTHG